MICRGLPASGKTTWAKKQVARGNWTRVNKDDLRAMLHGSGREGDWGFRGKAENMVLSIRDSIMVKALREGNNVVIDDTNLHPKHVDRIVEVVEAQEQIDQDYFKDKKIKYKWEVKDFDIPLHVAIKRDVRRSKSVGETVIRDMYNKYIRPSKRVTQDENAPQAIIVDMDGTLADLNGRNPYDASECEYDLPNYPVIDAVRKYVKDGYKLIICSGRSDVYAEQTKRWLDKNDIRPDLLLMRDPNKVDKEGKLIPDDELKRSMFLESIHNKYLVEAVFDDRERVVDAWRDLGLPVFQVAEGKF